MRLGPCRPHPLAAAFVLALALAGCASPSAPSDVPGPGGGPLTSPATAPSRPPAPFAGLASFLAHRTGLVTAAVYDRRTGRTWVLHGGVREETASIVKVEIMCTALHAARVAGRPVPADQLALMPPMIEHSDNEAATTLLAKVGGASAVQRFGGLAGLTATTVSALKYIPGTTLPGWGLTMTTALDQVRLVRRLAYPNALLPAASRRYGLGLMEHVEADQAWGVSAGVPAGVTVALKNGWLPRDIAANSDWQVNSIGWVHGDGRDYVLAVLTSHGPSQAYGEDTIGAISRRVFVALGTR